MLPTFLSTLALWASLNSAGQLVMAPTPKIVSTHEMSLNDRYPVKSVSDVFKDNILLNMAYLENKVSDPKQINWGEVESPFNYSFTLKPGQTFAFHDSVLPLYQASVVKTTNANFSGAEGFKSDGYLYGDGVCHLASLINWAAKDANLDVYAPTNHNFANIPQVPREFGVAIYDSPNAKGESAMENLYITNNQPEDVTFDFSYDGNNLKVTVLEGN